MEHSATVDVEVTIVQGSQFINSHTVIGKLRKPTYFVELELDDVKEQTFGAQKAENGRYDWDERFIFAAYRSSRLTLKLYCKHSTARSNHVVGEATHDVWDIPRHNNLTIDLHDAERRVSGKITLFLTVAATVTFSAGPIHSLDLQSAYSLSQMTKIVESLSGEDLYKFSSVWRRFIQSLGIVASTAQKISGLHPSVQVALGAVAFAVKIVLEQIDRDERIENMVGIMGDLYAYVADAYPIEKIISYKETLRRLLAQTTECAYFIGEYRKVSRFARRAVVNLVSDADTMIKRFEDTFRDMKIELILGSSLQTAVISFRVLQKVENIETILYTKELEPLKNVGWDSGRTCFRGTRNAIINDVVQWASNSDESGTVKNSRIYVLQGPHGCGKSSIAHSVAQAFHLQKRLGTAIFLDDRTKEEITRSQVLSTTIASQLAAYDQNIREAIAAKIEADASLAKADVERQFCDLIVSATKGLALIGPICIIIDGLEKIVDPAEQLRLLAAIADYFPTLPSNFRLLLTCREGPISTDITQLMPDCIIKEITFNDEGVKDGYSEHISQSLRHLFSKKSKLAEKYTVEYLHDQFIARSMGVYFWISTALHFLLLCNEGDERILVESILSTALPRTKEVTMDQLFRVILASIPGVHSICQILIRSSKPLPLQDLSINVSVSTSQSLYHSPILNMMKTLLIEHGRDKADNLLFTIHPSLEDFLTSSRRCHGTTLYVTRLDPAPSLSMADICFDSMERGLRHNMCDLDDFMVLNEEILDRDKRINEYIPMILQHACRNWMFHLEALDPDVKAPDSAVEAPDSGFEAPDSGFEALDSDSSRNWMFHPEAPRSVGSRNWMLYPEAPRSVGSGNWMLHPEAPDSDGSRNWMLHPEAPHSDYGSRNWIEAPNSDGKQNNITSALEQLDTFLSTHLLQWIECMSLLGWIDVVSTSLDRLASWLVKHNVSIYDDRYVLTKDAIYFIDMFAPMISKAAMRTHLSALPLMPSDSLLFKKYSATMVQSFVKLSASASGQSICRIIYNPQVVQSNTGSMIYDNTGSYDAIPIALLKSRTFGDNDIYIDCFAISPDGQWMVNKARPHGIGMLAVLIRSVETRSHARTIAGQLSSDIKRITFSADGKKMMFINHFNPWFHTISILDVTTNKFVETLELLQVSSTDQVAISRDGSKIAVANQNHIRIIDVISGNHIGQPMITPYANDESCCPALYQFIWSPNGQFVVSVIEDRPFTKAETYLLSFGNSIKLLNPCMGSRKHILDLACSPNSSKVAAIYADGGQEKILSISCSRTGNLIRTTSFTLASAEVRITFTSDDDILVCGCKSYLRFNIVPSTHFIQINAQNPFKFHPSETPLAIEYSLDTSGAIVDYASQVDAGGWILDTQGKRQLWTPWANYEVSCSCNPPQEARTQYRTLDVKDPETRGVVSRYVIAFEQSEDVNQVQETATSVE